MASDKTTLEVRCPACDHSHIVSSNKSVNVSRFVHFRKQILEGTYGQIECMRCNTKFFNQAPFFYTDFDKDQWIACYPVQWENQWEEFVDEIETMINKTFDKDVPPILESLKEDTQVRVVFGLQALREKLIAIDAGINDVHLEALKMSLLHLSSDSTPASSQRPRLLEVKSDTLIFSINKNGKRVPVVVSKEQLDFIMSNLDSWEKLINLLSDSSYVDIGRFLLERELPSPTNQPTP